MNTSNHSVPSSEQLHSPELSHWIDVLSHNHNGQADIPALLHTPYGNEMQLMSHLRFRFEKNPMGKECLAYYSELGIYKEAFDTGDFFSRYYLFSPLELESKRRYPLLFWHHGGGNPIETDEFSVHLPQMAAREKFFVCMLQNYCWDHLDQVLDRLLCDFPIDPERVYVIGYSLGGQAAHSALMRIPRRLAGVAPCGSEVMPLWDHLNIRYTMEEAEEMQSAFVPVVQMAGQYEFPDFLPMNRHISPRPRTYAEPVNLYAMPGNERALDPTYPRDLPRADKAKPPVGTDPDVWKLSRLNLRLETLGAAPRDIGRCLSFRSHPEDALHHAMGFYGDREETRILLGLPHYLIEIDRPDGMPCYRYVGVANSPHWPPLLTGELCWEFLRNFRRDTTTGQITFDPYIA